MNEKAAFIKIAESLVMNIRTDMEAHPDRYVAQAPPTKEEILAYMTSQSEDPTADRNYVMKMAESIKRCLQENQGLIAD